VPENNRGELEKILAKPWSGQRITKNRKDVHAGRSQRPDANSQIMNAARYTLIAITSICLISAKASSSPLNIQLNNGDVILSWTNSALILQSAPLAPGSYTNVPGVTSPYTTGITGSQMFFRLYSPPAPFGIYMGKFAGEVDNGGFAMMVRTNGQGVVVVGYNSPQGEGVYAASYLVANNGGFSVNIQEGGTASGALTTGDVTGNFTDSTGGTGDFSGTRKPDTGIQQANAGYYTGTFSGLYSGSVYAVLAADGTIFFYTYSSPGNDGGGFGTIDAENSFSATTVPDNLTVTGTLNPTTHVISGSYGLSGTPLGTYSLSLNTSP
jgi:hypothetical protein